MQKVLWVSGDSTKVDLVLRRNIRCYTQAFLLDSKPLLYNVFLVTGTNSRSNLPELKCATRAKILRILV